MNIGEKIKKLRTEQGMTMIEEYEKDEKFNSVRDRAEYREIMEDFAGLRKAYKAKERLFDSL